MARRSSPLFRAAILLTASTMTLTPFAADAQLTPMGRADSNRPLLGKLQPPLVSAQASAGTPPPGYPPAKCQSPPPPASPPRGQSRNALPNSPFPATWQAVLDSYVAEGKIPGGVIIVKSPDWGVRVGVAGKANIVAGTPVSPNMQFRVGSVSKAFLGQAILRLEQQGKLRLTDPVLKYLGDNPVVAGIPDIDKVTVKLLLQMNSGIKNYLEGTNIGFSPQITPNRAFTPSELMADLSGKPPALLPDYAPGTTYPNPYWLSVLNPNFPQNPLPWPSPQGEPAPYPAWTYTNSGYILLGMIAEKITGMPPEKYLKSLVFDTVGLDDTYFATTDKQLPQMHGYTRYGAIPYPSQVYKDLCDVTQINPSYAWTAGAIVSTPWDLLKFEDAMFERDDLLNAGSKNKWFTFVSSDIHPGWEVMQYGVGGLMQPERAYGTARGHGGAFPGYKALLYYFYDQKTSFVLAINNWDQSYEVNLLDQIMPMVSSAVSTPSPANAASVKSAQVRLHWQAGRIYGDSYDVYWGTDARAVTTASASGQAGVQRKTVTDVTATIPVKPGATYYWRVDTHASPGQPLTLVIGPTWSFRAK